MEEREPVRRLWQRELVRRRVVETLVTAGEDKLQVLHGYGEMQLQEGLLDATSRCADSTRPTMVSLVEEE
jgi:hypothetical protein